MNFEIAMEENEKLPAVRIYIVEFAGGVLGDGPENGRRGAAVRRTRQHGGRVVGLERNSSDGSGGRRRSEL
jgi:hypothetical protein